MRTYLMKCNCSNVGTYANKDNVMVPYCGLHRCFEVVPDPDLTNRVSFCYCGKSTKSKIDIAFFKYRPEKEYDEYYCGCHGWD